jgi:ATP-dependent helicase HrpA
MKFDPEARRAARPAIAYDEALPVNVRRAEIAEAILKNQVVVICGETGSGKTTQLPKICLELGRGLNGLIGHTQPRRIAARATATRIAQELKSELGRHVGFKIRFTDKVTPSSYIKLMTDGILLAETQTDPLLRQYDTILIDEAHERSLNIDFLLGYLKSVLARRRELKLIVTSATLDAERFSRHFTIGGKAAPVIEVSGRLHPIETRFRPFDEKKDTDLNDAIVDAVDEAHRTGPGDVLVFLPGEREIREAAEALRKHHPPGLEVLPLFARQTAVEQARVFAPHQGRRVVLATNVAETSLTVPGIRYVIDPGLARVKRYSHRNKVEQLQVEPISRAAASQRAGRCGRVSAGVCFKLYDEEDFNKRPAYTEPEILRSSLAGVILRMKSLHLGDVEDFPFLEAPAPRMIADGYQLLTELGALDEASKELTKVGVELAKLPLDPKIGRMILAAREHNCLREVLIIAAALSVQDPRDRPQEGRRFRRPGPCQVEGREVRVSFLSENLAGRRRGVEARDLEQAAPVVPPQLHQLAAPARVARCARPADDAVPRARLEGEPDPGLLRGDPQGPAHRPARPRRPDRRGRQELPRRARHPLLHPPRLRAGEEGRALDRRRRAGGDLAPVRPLRGPD